MTKQVYPVIFTQTEAEVLIEVPDLEILTQGQNLTEAINVARDAIGITILSREEHDETVRRNVTLPNWLNQEANRANINVSRILQDALMQKLNVK